MLNMKLFWLVNLCGVLIACVISSDTRASSEKSYKIDDIIYALKQQDSVIYNIKYESKQIKRRTVEGIKILEKAFPGRVEKLDDPELPARYDFVRIQDGEREYLKTTLFNDDSKSINNTIINTWDGSIGKSFFSRSNSGRIIKERFSVDEEMPERTGLELLGKPLYEWLEDKKDFTNIDHTPEGIWIVFPFQPNTEARYLLDSTKCFIPLKHEIIQNGQICYKVETKKIEKFQVNGFYIYFPTKYETTFSTIDITNKSEFRMVPLVLTEVQISNVQFNKSYPDDQFDLQFPSGASIYDEFIERIIPTRLSDKVIEDEIERQAKSIASEVFSQISSIPKDTNSIPKDTNYEKQELNDTKKDPVKAGTQIELQVLKKNRTKLLTFIIAMVAGSILLFTCIFFLSRRRA